MTRTNAGEDRSVVAAAIRGDVEAVRALWQEHRRWVAAVLLAHKPRESELEDLLQDVAMSFVRTIGKLRDESMLRPWLRTVAINAARAAGRDASRRRKYPRLSLAQADGVEPVTEKAEPAAVAGDGDAADRILALAAGLPEGYREPLILRCVRGMSYRQIAELTGLPETTIETRIARGRRMLRDLVNGGGVEVGAGAES